MIEGMGTGLNKNCRIAVKTGVTLRITIINIAVWQGDSRIAIRLIWHCNEDFRIFCFSR